MAFFEFNGLQGFEVLQVNRAQNRFDHDPGPWAEQWVILAGDSGDCGGKGDWLTKIIN